MEEVKPWEISLVLRSAVNCLLFASGDSIRRLEREARFVTASFQGGASLWSALTCQRFGLRRPVAVVLKITKLEQSGRSGEWTEILAGVNVGDQVIVDPGNLQSGMLVEIVQ